MRWFGVLLIVGVLVKQSYSSCESYAEPVDNRCSFPGNIYLSVGESRKFGEPRCERCTCQTSGGQCCSTVGQSVSVPDDCEVIREDCQLTMVKKEDNTVPCTGPMSMSLK